MGYLAEQDDFEPADAQGGAGLRHVVASFNVEDFSLERMKQIGRPELNQRMQDYRRMLSF